MKRISGFTIVEVLVVVVIITILTGITTLAYAEVQKQSHDSTRKSNTTLIAAALEKYYNVNNEYPSVAKLVNNIAGNTGTVVSGVLGLQPTVLATPLIQAGTTNALSTTAATASNDYIQYTATSVVNNAYCQSLATAGCDQFDLTYYQEATGSTATVKSQHRQ